MLVWSLNMCKGLKQLLKEEREKGIAEGKTEGRAEVRKESAKKIISYFIANGMSEDEAANEVQKILSFH